MRIAKELVFHARVGTTQMQTVPIGHVVAFVGANGAGKSQVLQDLQAGGSNNKVLKSLVFQKPSFEEYMEILQPFIAEVPHETNADMVHLTKFEYDGDNRGTHGFPVLKQQLRHFESTGSRAFVWSNIIRLSGKTRFASITQLTSTNFKQSPKNVLDALLRNDEGRRKVRNLFFEAFGYYLLIDLRDMQKISLCVSDVEPPNEVERSVSDIALKFFRNTRPLETMSDGAQCYASILCAVQGLPHKIILLDEPEAFLHPPMARKLAAAISKIACERDASLFVATHSSSFLIGCAEANPAETTVIRLGFENNKASVNALGGTDLDQFFLNPLLRHSGGLDALFHKRAIVTEAESDRVFYDEINRRLIEKNLGVQDVSLLFGNGWQSVAKILKPLRSIGIPSAAILDFDVLMEPQFERFCTDIGILDSYLSRVLTSFRKTFQSIDRKLLKMRGLTSIVGSPPDLQIMHECLILLSAKGIFLVSVGELEGWLSAHSLKGAGRSAKREFIENALEKLARKPSELGYIAVESGDVWAFLQNIAMWLLRGAD